MKVGQSVKVTGHAGTHEWMGRAVGEIGMVVEIRDFEAGSTKQAVKVDGVIPGGPVWMSSCFVEPINERGAAA